MPPLVATGAPVIFMVLQQTEGDPIVENLFRRESISDTIFVLI
jgi:hypothetical protein